MNEEELRRAMEEMAASCGERSLRYLADEVHSANELKMQTVVKHKEKQ